MIEAISIELLMAVALTALGAFVASHIQRMGGFSVVTQLLLFPMLVISGAPPVSPCSATPADRS